MSDAPKDVQMIHAGLCTVVDPWGALPIFGHTVDGNRNGHTAVAEQLALAKKHLKLTELTLISDRGTFSAGHLLRLSQSGFAAIAAAPWDDFRSLFDEQRTKLKWKRASYLSIEQQRRRQCRETSRRNTTIWRSCGTRSSSGSRAPRFLAG